VERGKKRKGSVRLRNPASCSRPQMGLRGSKERLCPWPTIAEERGRRGGEKEGSARVLIPRTLVWKGPARRAEASVVVLGEGGKPVMRRIVVFVENKRVVERKRGPAPHR